MSMQKHFQKFHKSIKVETDELREKRDILVNKIRNSLKEAGHPLPEALNQGSYIYGVGVFPVGDEEYDIDVGLDFPIKSDDYEATTVRKWVYGAIKDHTNNIEDRGPCIRVRYAAGYHVDLVVYARYKNTESVENYQLAYRDNKWSPAEPKKLKENIQKAREPFADTKDSSGSDQLQRVTRYLKRWNDLDISGDSPDKPSGLATLLLVMKHLTSPALDSSGDADDLAALTRITRAVKNTFGRVVVQKPTQQFEDMYSKLNDKAMTQFKDRIASLLSDLEKAATQTEESACKTLRKQFGDDFPEVVKKSEDSSSDRSSLANDMKAAIPSFNNPSRPWAKT